MKYIILFLISINAFAGGFAPLEKPGYTEGSLLKYYEFQNQCEEAEKYPCYDVDKCPVVQCDLIDEIVNGDPIYGERGNVLACVDEAACEILRPTHCQEIPESFFFYAMKANDGFEAYCTKIISYTKIKTGKKLLVENPQKLAAHLQRLKDQKDAKEATEQSKLQKCNAWKNANLDQATTIAQMRVMLKLKQDCDKE